MTFVDVMSYIDLFSFFLLQLNNCTKRKTVNILKLTSFCAMFKRVGESIAILVCTTLKLYFFVWQSLVDCNGQTETN